MNESQRQDAEQDYYVYLDTGVYVKLPANSPQWLVKQEAVKKFKELFEQGLSTICMLIEPDELEM